MGRYDVLLEQEKTKQTPPSVSTPPATVAPPQPPAPLPAPEPDRAARSSRLASSVHPKSSTVQPRKREFARRSFDFYADQIDYLTRTSLEERLNGGEGSMNAMVREALDDYIKNRKARK